MVLLAKEQVEVKLTPQEIVEKTTIADVYRAVKNLDGVIYKTKLIYSDYFSNLSHNDIYIKPENLQKTGSFKLRGAYNCISQLSEEQKAHGVIAASAGNHAQGVAYAAQQLGVKAVIVMPATTPLLKVEATRAYGAEVVLSGDSFDDAAAKASSVARFSGSASGWLVRERAGPWGRGGEWHCARAILPSRRSSCRRY